MLKEVIGNKIDILIIPETKLDDTFPLSQFISVRFTPPYRLDRTEHCGGLMIFVREDITYKLLPNVNPSGNIENIFVKITLRSKNCLILGSYNLMLVLFKIPQSIYVKILIFVHLYMKTLFKEFCASYNLKNLIK